MESASRLRHTLFYVTVQVADMKSGRWIFFTFAWLGMVLYFTQRWIFGPVIPTLMTRFGVDKTSIGLIGSASIWGYMLTPILAGLISDRFGRKYAVLAGIIAGLYGLGQFLGRPVVGWASDKLTYRPVGIASGLILALSLLLILWTVMPFFRGFLTFEAGFI